jgi:hypothetical protein
MQRSRTAVVAAMAVALWCAPASAQSPEDPSADSPSGTIYEIPLDDGRGDAAPRGQGGTEAPRSSIHSENGFGSSSNVPGTEPAEPAATAAPGAETAGRERPKDEESGSSKPEDGGRGAAEGDIPPATVIRQGAGDGSPAVPRALTMVGLAVLVAAGLALAAGMAARRR